jgi:hypothetical protein
VLAVILGAAVVGAGVLGFRIGRWWLVAATTLVGSLVIAVDISTRDLQSDGHDDRVLVAVSETALLLVVIGAAACGTLLRQRYPRERNSR